MQVERYVPHGSVLPHAALLVSHAGMGSVVAAASAGVPMMCIPLGRDQHHNAGLVSQLGYGATASAEDDVETLRAAFAHALARADFRSSAQRLRSSLSRYGGAAAAADVVQRRVNTTAS
jgi:UDP:flavonoid glycosyltransferase YjiC (YdhE family)